MREQPKELDKDILLLDSFAAKYCLAIQIETSEIKPIIRGDNGHIFVYSDVPPMLAVAWSPDNLSSEQWSGSIRKMLRLGFTVIRDCASESISSFGIANSEQASLAIALADIKPAAGAIAQNAEMCGIITRARARKGKQLQHQRVIRELKLLRAGADLSDYCPDFLPGEHRLHL